MTGRPLIVAAAALAAASVVAVAPGAAGEDPQDVPLSAAARDSTTAWAAADSTSPASPAPLSNRVVVYYFHRTARCENCLRFEAYTAAALEQALGDELARGLVEWHVVNVDGPEEAHYLDDYGLEGSAVIVSVVIDGSESAWEDLDAIWTLVEDREAFEAYVVAEVRAAVDRVRRARRSAPPALRPMRGPPSGSAGGGE